jgi:hypothetical protein
MKPFNRIFRGLNVRGAAKEVEANYHLFGELNARKNASPIHAQMDDIWLRFAEIPPDGDYSKITDEHDSVWLKNLPECMRICFAVMSMVDGERLGGVLITRLPPKGKILPHTDSGWHASYYDKYYVPLKNESGADFCFDNGTIKPDIGDVWGFDNSHAHWVNNDSDSDRIAMIICIKQDKYNRKGALCLGQQQQ